MQRIDENTYIDETLVTCAEYQLFIDEMLEQDKYYQPDHWSSFQFQSGYAKEPILGVRYSDAVDFCQWLSERESHKWDYRLPTRKEIIFFPLLKKYANEPLGYWMNDDLVFFWIQPSLKNQLRVNLSPASARLFEYNLAKDFATRLVHLNEVDENQKFLNTRGFLYKANSRIICENALMRARGRYVETQRNREDCNNDIDTRNELYHIVTRIMVETDIVFAEFQTQQPKLENSQKIDFDKSIDSYLDIFTIQERFYGKYPAFEGIRLVKYREQS